MKTEKFQDLKVWNKAHRLVLDIYKLTQSFPAEEKFGLVSQLKKCAVSVPANIAEGYKRNTYKQKINFYNIAQGSLEEVNYYLILSQDLGFIKNTNPLLSSTNEIGKMLTGLIQSLNKIGVKNET